MERGLSPAEHANWLVSQVMPSNVVSTARIRGPLIAEHVERGLERLQRRHPLLRVRFESRTSPRFTSAGVGRIPLRIVERHAPDTWHAELEHELDREFSSTDAPLAQATLVRSAGVSELLLSFHHAIGDGFSGAYALRDLLRATTDSASEVSASPGREPVHLLLPPSAKRAAAPLDPWIVARGLRLLGGALVFPLRLPAHLRSLPYTPNLTTGEQQRRAAWRTRVAHASLPAATTHELVARCRREGTTVQGALCAALLLSIRGTIAADRLVRDACVSTVNIRSRLNGPIGADEFGLYVALVTTFPRVRRASTLWDVARDVRHQLTEVLSHDRRVFAAFRATSLMRVNNPMVYLGLLGLITGGRGLAAVTNVGRMPIPAQFGPLTIENLHLVGNPLGATQLMLSASTFGGELTCNFCYNEPYTPPAAAQAVCDAVMHRLAHATRS